MNDPDYKPPPGENEKKILITGGPSPDLRNVRIQPKQRRKTANEEPECIALSSDEENEDESPEQKAEDGEAENDTEKGANKDNNQADPKQGENGESGGNAKKDGEGMYNSGLAYLVTLFILNLKKHMKNELLFDQSLFFNYKLY